MTRKDAEKTISEYMKPIYGFTLKRCKSEADAEDLSQEIVLRAFKALTVRDDITDIGKFIGTIAHNALANYYRDGAKTVIGVSIDEMAEILADDSTIEDDTDNAESMVRLRSEIAYLSKERRKIVIAYYFENKKQSDIASSFGIPLGTVKWHLFEAKKDLKKGMNTMRKTSDLKFNPIRFSAGWINGSGNTNIREQYLHSALSQNICYDIKDTYKSVNEIADDLGVSPVYVETEVERLAWYGLLKEAKGKYIANFIMEEPTAELLTLQNDMYKKAAELYTNDLYDELISSGILDDKDIWCGQTDEAINMKTSPRADHNFILWSLIPYITALSNVEPTDETERFVGVSTIRPDGSDNIFTAVVQNDNIVLPDDYVHMKNWCGPMWKKCDDTLIWQVNSEWSEKGRMDIRNDAEMDRLVSLYTSEGEFSDYDYAWLFESGYAKVCRIDGCVKTSWQIVQLANKDIEKRLLDIGKCIKEKYKTKFDELKVPYVKASLGSVPVHLRRVREYELQNLFQSDGWFLLHCIVCLLKNGKLKEPTEGQRKALSTVIISNIGVNICSFVGNPDENKTE